MEHKTAHVIPFMINSRPAKVFVLVQYFQIIKRRRDFERWIFLCIAPERIWSKKALPSSNCRSC